MSISSCKFESCPGHWFPSDFRREFFLLCVRACEVECGAVTIRTRREYEGEHEGKLGRLRNIGS